MKVQALQGSSRGVLHVYRARFWIFCAPPFRALFEPQINCLYRALFERVPILARAAAQQRDRDDDKGNGQVGSYTPSQWTLALLCWLG